MQFLDTASKLHIFTIKQCVKFPKRYTFYVSQDIASASSEILECAKCANSIYPTNAREVQMRREYLLQAYAKTQSLISLIGDAKELFEISGNIMAGWMELIQAELGLLRGVMKNDKQRYRRFEEYKNDSISDDSTNQK